MQKTTYKRIEILLKYIIHQRYSLILIIEKSASMISEIEICYVLTYHVIISPFVKKGIVSIE